MKTAQEFLQEWEKEENPFYPLEYKWDRLNVNQFARAYDVYVKATNIFMTSVVWIDKTDLLPGQHPEFDWCTKYVLVTDGKNWGFGYYSYDRKCWTYTLVGENEKDDNNVIYWAEPLIITQTKKGTKQ